VVVSGLNPGLKNNPKANKTINKQTPATFAFECCEELPTDNRLEMGLGTIGLLFDDDDGDDDDEGVDVDGVDGSNFGTT